MLYPGILTVSKEIRLCISYRRSPKQHYSSLPIPSHGEAVTLLCEYQRGSWELRGHSAMNYASLCTNRSLTREQLPVSVGKAHLERKTQMFSTRKRMLLYASSIFPNLVPGSIVKCINYDTIFTYYQRKNREVTLSDSGNRGSILNLANCLSRTHNHAQVHGRYSQHCLKEAFATSFAGHQIKVSPIQQNTTTASEKP